jgi:TatD DNase family protein
MDYIDIHTHANTATGKYVLNLFPSENLPELSGRLFSIGLHPWDIDNNDYDDKIKIISKLAEIDSCIAIGETGLDKLSTTNFDLQKIIFQKHIEIADEYGKPLIIHCVRAFDELMQIKKMTGSKVPWIVHGFNSKIQVAEKLIDEGLILSFGKALTQPGSNAQKVLEIISDNGFFLETDDSSLSIQEIYIQAANTRKISIAKLMAIIKENFEQTFTLKNE